MPDDDALIHLRIPAALKARWVRDSRAAGQRLTDWIVERVERTAGAHMLAEMLTLAGTKPQAPAHVRALAAWLPRAVRRTLTADDLRRIDAYAGGAEDLHALLPAVLPLAAPVWYEAQVTAQHGTRMVMGYGATPAGPGELDVWCAAGSVGSDRIMVPAGPLRLDRVGIDPRADIDAAGVRELRAAAGIVLRALMLGCGT